MPRTRPSRRPRLTLVLLVLASITIITLDFRGDTSGVIPALRSTAEDAFSPIRSAVDAAVDPVAGFVAGAANAGALERENALLRAENGALRRDALQVAATRARMAAISALDHLPWAGSLARVDAEVVAANSSNFATTIVIDKGTSRGVAVGMPVVAGAGLVGRVVQAWSTGSTVSLITSTSSQVGVTLGAKGSLALAAGQGRSRSLQVDYVVPGTRLHKGEVLFTSGLQGGTYPPGIPVAFVRSFSASGTSTQESVVAEPEVDLADLQYVSVIEWEPSP